MVSKRIQSILLIAFGNIVEWYDFSLFGYFSVTLSRTFFPSSDSVNSLMATFLTFFIGLLARPLGGYLLGRIGDLDSREKCLRASIYLMVIPTTLIGVIPSYQDIGIVAPALLIVLRFCQGLCAGGQYSGAVVLSYESAHRRHRALQCSFNHVASMGGYGLAIVVSLISFHVAERCGTLSAWRIPFLISPIIVVVYAILRQHWGRDCIQEAHDATHSAEASSFFHVMVKYRWNFLLATLLASCGGIFYFTLFVYMMSFLVTQAHITTEHALAINGIAITFSCLSVVCCALLVDRWGEKQFIQISVGLICLASWLFIPIASFSTNMLAVLIVLMVILNSAFIAAVFVIYPQFFPKSIRLRGFSFSYNVGAGLFGGIAPLLATWLVHQQGVVGITELLSVTCFVALIALHFTFKLRLRNTIGQVA